MSPTAARDKAAGASKATSARSTTSRIRASVKAPVTARSRVRAKAPTRAEQSPRSAGRRTVREGGQLGVLAVMIILGLVGFAVHFLWIAVILLMAVLWAHMASKFRGSRSNRDAASDVVNAVSDEMRGLADSASSALSDVGRHNDNAQG